MLDEDPLVIVAALDQALDAGDADAVRAHATQLLNDVSDNEVIRTHASYALLFIGDAAEALPHLPPDAHVERASALRALGRFDEARREAALAEASGDVGARQAAVSVENAANKAGQYARDHAAITDPLDAEMERAASDLLRRGEWDAGMTAYVQMYEHSDGMGTKALSRIGGGECPAWSGATVDHLLAVCAAGNGDLLQFGRYITAARARCQRITLACEPVMHPLMQRVLPVDAVVGIHQISIAKQAADAYTVVGMLLANALKMKHGEPMSIKPIAGSVPDLGDGVHVGLCWAASAHGMHRSVRFAALSPLRYLPGVHFHSLQVGEAADEAGPWVKRHALSSYEDTTSLIAALDAVISVDTSVAHLAANIGKPTHLLLCPYEDWRWGMSDTTPWYPSMRLYRGNRGRAVDNIAAVVRKLARREVA
jgi:hypothetical protein